MRPGILPEHGFKHKGNHYASLPWFGTKIAQKYAIKGSKFSGFRRDVKPHVLTFSKGNILVPRGRAPFGQHQESRPLAESNTGSPRFTDFPSLCACSESSLTNLIGSGLNLLCLQSHSKPECRWTRPEVAILGADQKERGLWGRECKGNVRSQRFVHAQCRLERNVTFPVAVVWPATSVA